MAAHQPAEMPAGPRSTRGLQPLLQHGQRALEVAREVGEDRRQVVVAAHEVGEVPGLLGQAVCPLDRFQRFLRAAHLRETDGEALRGLGGDET